MSEKLKPCPFCGNKTPEAWTVPQSDSHVTCMQCGAGIYGSDIEQAITAWNMRANEKQAITPLKSCQHFWNPHGEALYCSLCGAVAIKEGI